MIIFGGVDTEQKRYAFLRIISYHRFNDLFSYEFEQRRWTYIDTTGNIP